MKLSEFECADCGATINEGEYVTFGVCDKCFQKNYRERMGLPEEKKNTMENNDKIFIDGDFNDSYEARIQRSKGKKKNKSEPPSPTASGSVAAPKEETLKQAQIDYYENKLEGMFRNQADQETELATLRQQLETLRGFVKEVDASLYHGPDLEDKEIMQHYIEVFKIIKEEAKKLLSEGNNKPLSREPVN